MTINANLSALKRTRWYEYALRFFFGGAVTVATGLIAKHYGPVFGGLTINTFPNLVNLPCLEITRSIVAPMGRPILSVKRLTLKSIAAYPIITYDARFSGRRKVMSAFSKAGIKPNVVFSAIDADVSKTYVEMGLGIAILADVAFDRRHDVGLRMREAHHLFESSVLSVTLRANTYLRKFTTDFIGLIAPTFTFDTIRAHLQTHLEQSNE